MSSAGCVRFLVAVPALVVASQVPGSSSLRGEHPCVRGWAHTTLYTSNTSTSTLPTSLTVPPTAVDTNGDLATKLDLRNLPLATTEPGRMFTLKALHPAEHTIKATRCPGGNMNTVSVMSDMVYTYPVSEADTTAVIYQYPHPICPAFVGLGGAATGSMFYNAAFGGSVQAPSAVMETLSKSFAGLCERYRINAQSVTVELIAPALSDQGTVTAAILPFTKQRFYAYKASSDAATLATNPVDYYDPPTDESTWLLGASAYTAKAKEGVYQPLKLTSFKFRESNEFLVANSSTDDPPFLGPPIVRTAFPYFSLSHTINATSSTYGAIMFRGIAANTALRVRVRQVVEMVVKPGTTFAPMAEPAPPPDSTAVKMYFEVSSRMKDGYPASYNDLGKLFEVIKRIGKTVLPYVEPALAVLSKVPGPIGLAASGVRAAKDAAAGVVAAHRALKAAQGKKKAKKKLEIKRPA